MARRIALVLLTAAALALGGTAAWAYWSAAVAAGAAGGALAASVNAAQLPTANRTSTSTVVLSWSAVTLTNGRAVDGYVVKRYDTNSLATQTVLGTCTGTVTGLTCTETGVPVGSWRYSVYPRIGQNWTGTESPLTDPVLVVTPTLNLARTSYNGPATTTGTVTGFGVNEAITYRLDSGTSLTGFPAVVDTTGSAPISSLSIPATTEGTHTVYVIGANGSVASTTILVDTIAPAISSAQSPVAAGTGWTTTSPVSVSLTATDAGSGVASVKYTTDGSDPVSSGTALTYSGPFNLASSANVRYYAVDAAGNASAVGNRVIQVDAVAPANSLALTSVTGAVLKSGTIYYKGSANGSFTITDTVTDATSGPASSTTSALGGTSTGFSHTPSTVTTPAGGPYVSAPVTWTAGAASAPTITVTGADVAGNTTATALPFANDSTAPVVGTVDVTGLAGTGSRYSTSTALNVARAATTDAGVGLGTGQLLQRATATLTNGVCGTYGGYSTVATDPALAYADTVADQACYRYRYVATDLLGNTATSAVSGDVKVDTTAPPTPSLGYSAMTNTYASGNTVYYRGSASSGSFTVTASSADAASGPVTWSFPAFGTGWTGTAGGTGVMTYSWSSASPSAPAAGPVTATNNAALTASTTLTPVNDSTPPTGAAPTYAAGYLSGPSVSVTIPAGTDGGSGVNTSASLLQRRGAPMVAGVCGTYGSFATVATGPSSPYADNTVANNNCYQYQYVYIDRVGNQQTYTSSVTVKAPKYYTCQAAITADNPDLYYQLADATGTAAVDSSGRTPARTGAYNGTVTKGIVGACGTGIGLTSAAAGYVSTPTQFTYPTSYSEEVWFRADTGTNTGRLLGFSANQTGSSSSYDRHLYMRADGKLVFGAADLLLVIPLREYLISPLSYNDGTWHHAVITQTNTGMTLYVDGVSVANNSSTLGQYYSGYWRVGWDSLAGWTGQSSTNYFSGSLSNAAFWTTTVLTPTQVFDHYIAGAVSSGSLLTAPSVSASAQSLAYTARRMAATASASASARPSPSITSATPSTPTPSASPSTSVIPSPSTPPPSLPSPSPGTPLSTSRLSSGP